MPSVINTSTHTPVLLRRAVEGLVVNRQGTYLDATFGRGGHSQGVLSQLSKTGSVIALDKDLQAVAVGESLHESDCRFQDDGMATLLTVLNFLLDCGVD